MGVTSVLDIWEGKAPKAPTFLETFKKYAPPEQMGALAIDTFKNLLGFEQRVLEPAFKVALRKPETLLGRTLTPEELKKTEQMRWPDILREAGELSRRMAPGAVPPEHITELQTPYGMRLAREFAAEMGGTTLERGLRPSTWITWAALERAIPAAARATFKRLPKAMQQGLLKERYLFGRSPIDLAYKELGLKKGASLAQAKEAYRRGAMRWHPDKAPAGQTINYTRRFVRIKGAYDKIKGELEAPTYMSEMIKRPTLPEPSPAEKTLMAKAGGMLRAFPKKLIQKGVAIAGRGAGIRITKPTIVKDIHGKSVVLKKGEEFTPYELTNKQILLQDGEQVVVNKNQLENLKGQATILGQPPMTTPGVKEIVKGTSRQLSGAEALTKAEEDYTQGKLTSLSLEDWERRIKAGDRYPDLGEGTKFAQYVLPGGKNYREVLLQTPTTPEEVAGQLFPGKTIKDLTAKEIGQVQNVIKAPYKSSHWDEPNVMAHIRLTDRKGPKGQKVLFIEEIQSDWAREGREKGFSKGEGPSFELNHKLSKALQRNDNLGFDTVIGAKEAILGHEDFIQRWEMDTETQAIAKEWRRARKELEGVPSHPLLKDWKETAMKKVLEIAAREGYDSISWTTGQQQADRYDLSKTLKEIKYKRKKEGFDVQATDIDDNLQYSAYGVSSEEVAKNLGKEIADKMSKGEGKIAGKFWNRLTGVDLKVGGEWAKSLYDVQVPSILKRLTKKWGGEVGPIKLGEKPKPKVIKEKEYARSLLKKLSPDELKRELENPTKFPPKALVQEFWDRVADIQDDLEAEGVRGDSLDYRAWQEAAGLDSEDQAEDFMYDIVERLEKEEPPLAIGIQQSLTLTPQIKEMITTGGAPRAGALPTAPRPPFEAEREREVFELERDRAYFQKIGWKDKVTEIQKKIDVLKREAVPAKRRGRPPKITNKQIRQLHIKASKINLIRRQKGRKLDTQYRRFLDKYFGVKTSTKLNTRQAEQALALMDALVISSKGYPKLPETKAVIPEGFFERTFKEPGLGKFFTPKDYYQRLMGTEFLVGPLTKGKELMHLESLKVNQQITNIIRKINEVGKTSLKEKMVSKLLNRPTNAVAKFRDLLDQYPTAPTFLSPEEQNVFNELRALTKQMLNRTNEVHKTLGLDPIRDVRAYVPHFVDVLTQAMLDQKYPFPEDVKYWLNFTIPKKIFNRSALERKIKDKLGDFFSKDLSSLLRAMVKYDLREIYLDIPYTVFRTQLNAFSDVIPASVRNELLEYVRRDIMGYPTGLDRLLNQTLKGPTWAINKLLAPLNRKIVNPIATLSSTIRRMVISATMWGRAKLPIRNYLQKLLNLNLYPVKHFVKTMANLTPKGVDRLIQNNPFFKISGKYEDIPREIMPFLERAGMIPYRWSHRSNVMFSMKCGYNAGMELMNNKGYVGEFVSRAKKDAVPVEDYLWTMDDVLKEMEEAGSLTQWKYFTTGMPQVFRGQGARAFFTLQSWWMNQFFKHFREIGIRLFSGKTSWGKPIPKSWRFNFLKGMTIIMGILEGVRRSMGLDYRRFFLLGALPAYLSPPGQFLLGLYQMVVARTDWEKGLAKQRVKRSWKAFVPGSYAWQDVWKVFITKEKPVKYLLSYPEWKPGAEGSALDVWSDKGGAKGKDALSVWAD